MNVNRLLQSATFPLSHVYPRTPHVRNLLNRGERWIASIWHSSIPARQLDRDRRVVPSTEVEDTKYARSLSTGRLAGKVFAACGLRSDAQAARTHAAARLANVYIMNGARYYFLRSVDKVMNT